MSNSRYRIRDLDNANFGTLNVNTNSHVISYNFSTNSFVLISADNILQNSVTDNDLPNNFIDVIESEIDSNNLNFRVVDGGSF